MAKVYVSQQVGVIDGTVNPPAQADGRQVNAKRRCILASKVAKADAVGDTISLGYLPANALITSIKILTDTSLGTSTIAIGTAASAAKYVAAQTFTTPLNTPTELALKASAVAAGPVSAAEELLVTVAVAALPVAAVVHFLIEYITNN